jgi:hypothetical protein
MPQSMVIPAVNRRPAPHLKLRPNEVTIRNILGRLGAKARQLGLDR